MLKMPLRGIIPPLVTPLLNNNTLDEEGLEKLIEHVISGGVHGIFVLGTTGEFASLSHKIRKELIRKSCRLVNGRVPVLVGISDSAFTESLNLSECATENGADAVVLTPPYYFSPGQAELLEYLKRIMQHIRLPMFIYNMPVHTNVNFAPETVKSAAEIPGVIGMKDSSGKLSYLNQIRYLMKDDYPDFTFLIGPEELLSEFVIMGGHGGINGGANLFPDLYVGLYEASLKKDFETIKKLQTKVMQISTSLYTIGHFGSSLLKGLKCALSVKGICNDFMAEPFHRFKEPERKKVKEVLNRLKLN